MRLILSSGCIQLWSGSLDLLFSFHSPPPSCVFFSLFPPFPYTCSFSLWPFLRLTTSSLSLPSFSYSLTSSFILSPTFLFAPSSVSLALFSFSFQLFLFFPLHLGGSFTSALLPLLLIFLTRFAPLPLHLL